MMNLSFRRPFLALIFLLPSGMDAADPYHFSEGALTIRTDRYELLWKNGSMVGAKTFLPRESSLVSSDPAQKPGLLPNGPGYRNDGGEKPIEFHPMAEKPIRAVRFTVNRSPEPGGKVVFERTEKGAQLTYGAEDSDLQWTQEFEIDPNTGDLIIAQKARSTRPGLSGISFGFYNLDAGIPLAVPCFPGHGQVWRGAHAKDAFVNLGYPTFWSAGLVIGMIPGGGSFAVWSDDAQMLPKYLRHYTDGKTRALGFDASLNYPYDQNTEAKVFSWRFNTFAGNWTEPASRYRDHLQRSHGMKPLAERSPEWINRIAMIWSTATESEEELAAMAEKLPPEKVILWHFSGSTIDPGINQKVPSYLPASGFVERNRRARALGFHVASYYSAALVDAYEHPSMIEDYGLGFYFDGLSGAEVKEATKRLIYVHPGSEKWRTFYSNKMRSVYDEYGVDVLYQDVSGTGPGSAGLVEGLNFHQAIVAADEAIHRAVPEAALAGEYWNEVTVVHESIGLQRSLGWGSRKNIERMSSMDLPHPISSLLFSPFSFYFGYKVSFNDTERWHRDQNMNEVIGSLPDWRGPVDDPGPEAAIVLLRAKLFAEGFRPWFPAEWKEGVVSYMRNDKGDVIEYRRKDGRSLCIRIDLSGKEALLYGRFTGLTELNYPEPVWIDQWIGYGKNGPIGLDPSRYYCFFPGAPKEFPLMIEALPKGVGIESFRNHDEFLFIGLSGRPGPELLWRADDPDLKVETGEIHGKGYLLATRIPPEEVTLENVIPFTGWSHAMTNHGIATGRKNVYAISKRKVEGKELEVVTLLPPEGGTGSEGVIERVIKLPESPRLALSFQTGRLGGAGDGVHYVVRINGREIWRSFSASEVRWKRETVDLTSYAGKTVLLTLGVDAGPSGFNRSNDQSLVGDLRLSADAANFSGISERQIRDGVTEKDNLIFQ